MDTLAAANLEPRQSTATGPIASVADLAVTFVQREKRIAAVNGVSFDLAPGEVLTILGESGSGKSITLRALVGSLPAHAEVSGRIRIAGHDLLAMDPTERRRLRGPVIAMVFQEPMSALDPVFTIGEQIAETILAHDNGTTHAAAMRRARGLLEMVAIPSAERRLNNYPHEMSGGMRQRAMIALALACQPSILLADEPTTALDATVQIQILLLLRELQAKLGMSVIFVTHDVGVAAEIADRVAVMYGGRFVETGSAEDVMKERRHPYTEGLLASTVHGGMRGKKLEMIGGHPPDPSDLPPGCAFAPRCRYAVERCWRVDPPAVAVGDTRIVRCIRALSATV